MSAIEFPNAYAANKPTRILPLRPIADHATNGGEWRSTDESGRLGKKHALGKFRPQNVFGWSGNVTVISVPRQFTHKCVYMACVDRTTEFSTIVNALKVRDGPSAIVQAPQPPGLKPGASDHARFTAAVAAIGREVHNTSMKVAEMAKRA